MPSATSPEADTFQRSRRARTLSYLSARHSADTPAARRQQQGVRPSVRLCVNVNSRRCLTYICCYTDVEAAGGGGVVPLIVDDALMLSCCCRRLSRGATLVGLICTDVYRLKPSRARRKLPDGTNLCWCLESQFCFGRTTTRCYLQN